MLFYTTKQNVSLHIRNILNDGELTDSTVKEILTVRSEGTRKVLRKIELYNLDMIISIGYRINSKKGIVFRKWANQVLKEYLLKGYVINENRVTVSNENYIELKNEVTSINNRLLKIEDKVLDNEYKVNKTFFNGKFYDSYTLIQQIFESYYRVIYKILKQKEMIVIEKYELVKFVDGKFELEVNVSPKEEIIWMTLDEIAILFERDKSVISRHIKKFLRIMN